MLSNSFNLIDHSCVSLLLECQQQGIKITNVGIFASGLLCGAPRCLRKPRSPFAHSSSRRVSCRWGGEHYMYDSSVPEDVKKKVAKWTELAKKHGLTLPQVALNFAFLPEIVDFVAFGTSRAKAVDENLELCGNTVPLALWAEAKEAGIMDSRLPLPGEEGQAAKKARAS